MVIRLVTLTTCPGLIILYIPVVCINCTEFVGIILYVTAGTSYSVNLKFNVLYTYVVTVTEHTYGVHQHVAILLILDAMFLHHDGCRVNSTIFLTTSDFSGVVSSISC